MITLAACNSPERRPNVLFILIDTLRADRLGCYDNSGGLTPFLDRFSAGATVFRHTYATSSWTAPSVASLFTSRYPSQHGVVSVATKLEADEVTLPELMAEAGYRTGAVVANDVVAARIGYDQGFELFRNVAPNAKPVREAALEWLDGLRPGAPVLLYLHFMDPHWPYTPPQEYVDRLLAPGFDGAAAVHAISRKIGQAFAGQYVNGTTQAHRLFTCEDVQLLESLYDAEVAAMDGQLALLFEDLERRHFLDHSLIVITSDHGEEFFEHGSLWHAYTLYEESIKVPLIVRLPGQTRGRVVEQPVSLLDVAPTLLRVLGLDRPASFEGTALVDLLDGHRWLAPRERWQRWRKPVDVIAELEGDSPRQPQRRVHAAAVLDRPHKLLLRARGEPELYDLTEDPAEQSRLDRAGIAPELFERAHRVQRAMSQATANEAVTLDAATRERLKALGYGWAEDVSKTAAENKAEPHPEPASVGAKDELASPTRRDLCAPEQHAPDPVAPPPSTDRAFF